MSNLVVIQTRDYRLHQLEVQDRGKAGYKVFIHPPPNRGASREVTPDGACTTLAELLNRAKAEVDVVMGPKPPPRVGGYGRGPR